MKKSGLLLSIALVASGCLPFHTGNYGGGAQAAPERELRFDSPRLSPDGKTILFAFHYKHYPWMLAVASSDPAESKVRVLKFPPTDDWIQPNFGPDPEHFTVISYCTHDRCYEGAKGYNVWLITAQPKDNLKRITPDDPDVRRADPVFGATTDDLYWFVSDNRLYPNVHMDVSDRYLAHMVNGKETILFPQAPSNGDWKSKHGRDLGDLTIIAAYGAGRYDEEGYYFTGMTEGGSSSAAEAAADKVGKFHNALYRYAKGRFELVEPVEVEYADAPRGGHGYVAMAHHFIKEHSGAVADFRAMQDGRMLWSFRFPGPAYSTSASDDLKAVVFDAERGFVDAQHVWNPRLQDSIFLWREGMAQALDLGLPERVKATVEAEIAAEKAAHAAPQPPASNPGPSP